MSHVDEVKLANYIAQQGKMEGARCADVFNDEMKDKPDIIVAAVAMSILNSLKTVMSARKIKESDLAGFQRAFLEGAQMQEAYQPMGGWEIVRSKGNPRYEGEPE